MAPESLYFSVFTPKLDVWSFGILMWEIVTLGSLISENIILMEILPGSTPYPGMGAREVMRRVRDGYRLERPHHCHQQIYLIIQVYICVNILEIRQTDGANFYPFTIYSFNDQIITAL